MLNATNNCRIHVHIHKSPRGLMDNELNQANPKTKARSQVHQITRTYEYFCIEHLLHYLFVYKFGDSFFTFAEEV